MPTTKRLDFIDTAKGISILLVLYLHICLCYPEHPYLNSTMRFVVSSFFMPVFFVLGGLFFSVKQEFGPWIRKKAERLLVPYLFFYVLTYLMSLVVVKVLGHETKNPFSYLDIFQVFYRDVFANGTIWFLLALFWASCVLYGILRLIQNEWVRALAVAVFTSIGLLCDHFQFNIPLYVDTAMSMLPFLYLGYLGKRFNVIDKVMSLPAKMQYVGFVVGAVAFGAMDWIFGRGISLVNNSCGDPANYLWGGVSGSLAVICISLIVRKVPIVTYVGRNSIVMLCVHSYLLNVFTLIAKKLPMTPIPSSLVVLLLVCLSLYMVVPAFRRVAPWAIGE